MIRPGTRTATQSVIGYTRRIRTSTHTLCTQKEKRAKNHFLLLSEYFEHGIVSLQYIWRVMQ